MLSEEDCSSFILPYHPAVEAKEEAMSIAQLKTMKICCFNLRLASVCLFSAQPSEPGLWRRSFYQTFNVQYFSLISAAF